MAIVRVNKPVLSGTAENTPAALRRPRVVAYVDESGDRNSGENRQSDYFTMTAVMVESEHEHQLRLVIEGAKAIWNIRGQLHWVKHLRGRRADRRETLCEILSVVPGVQVIHVILNKAMLLPETYLANNQEGSYNYASRLLLERIAHAADKWPGGARIAQVYFGLVGGVDPGEVARYLNHCATHRDGPGGAPWDAVKWPLKFEPTSARAGLQAADMYSGMLWVALQYGDRKWFDMVHDQIYRSASGRIGGYGVKCWPREAVAQLAHLCEKRTDPLAGAQGAFPLTSEHLSAVPA